MSVPPRDPHALGPMSRLESWDETRPLRHIDDASESTEDVLLLPLVGRVLQDPPKGGQVGRGGWSDFADPRWAEEIYKYYCTLPEPNRKESGTPGPRVR